jgi:hypothetical protein
LTDFGIGQVVSEEYLAGMTRIGGISGCPCFKIAGEDKPIRLVGFATGFSEEQKRLQFTYARYIREDGVTDYTA